MKCVSTDVGTWSNWLTFEPNSDYSPDAGARLLSSISYKRCYAEFCVGKISHYTYWRLTATVRRGFNMVLFTERSKHLCRRYMRSIPSALLVKKFIRSMWGFLVVCANSGSERLQHVHSVPNGMACKTDNISSSEAKDQDHRAAQSSFTKYVVWA